MDIRNFTDWAPAPTPFTIKEIYDMQKALLDQYVKIEKIVEYPVNIDAPSAQVLIKDFIARVTEELGEAYESYLALRAMDNSGNLTPEKALPLIYNFNEELADATHFLMETLIVTGITHEELEKHIAEILFIRGYGMTVSGNLYGTIRAYLYYVLNIPTLLGTQDYKMHFDSENPFIQGGRVLTPEMEKHTALLMWNVTYYLQLARNSLKNKPWKQTKILSDKKAFKYHIIAAFIAFIALCEEVGINEDSFYNVYYAKNQVNGFRIASKY